MEDLSSKADGSMWPSGQLIDAVSDLSPAMTAPGSAPAQDVSPFRRNPDPAAAHPDRYDGRQLEHGGRDRSDSRAWDDVSGSRQPWG
jgi:hypothetical protein